MRVTACLCTVAVFAGLSAARPLRAQTLDDVARKEEERRKDVKAPAKLYTNKDLGAPPATSATPPPDAAKPATTTPASGAPAATDKSKDEPARDQKYWSTRKKDLETKLERDKVLADAMQSRLNGLAADFAARADPAQRAVIETDRKRAASELEGLQKSIKDGQKALADFDEEARKAGVPPGWLR